MTALMVAVKANDLATVEALLAGGVTVNEADSQGDWPVIMAAYLGHIPVLQQLLAAGADLQVVDPGMKATALHAAAYAGHAEACALLIEHGVELNRQGPFNGYTALHDAVWQSNLAAARVIVAAGADRSLRSKRGETPLDLARSSGAHELETLLSS